MIKTLKYFLIISFLLSWQACQNQKSAKDDGLTGPGNWALLPFTRIDSVNPVLLTSNVLSFMDPILEQPVKWEEKDVFNPAAIVRDGKVYLLYRAEDKIGIYQGTSRIGLAVSNDGMHFTKNPEPVFFPAKDSMKAYEWPGGCEDPRVVISEEGLYIMTYTAYEGKTARLCIAVSEDLMKWEKKGLAFGKAYQGKFKDTWSKSGSIICRRDGENFIAVKIGGKYQMYWGDTDIFLAHSNDLLSWEPLVDAEGNLKPVLKPRQGFFDSDLIEPGPPAMMTDQGILLIYNSRNKAGTGDPEIPDGTYSAGQALFNKTDPSLVKERLEKNFFMPEKEYEISGQVNQVCFLEGLVYFQEKYFLYYGTADSKIAVAVKK
ncbi:MAG TPA: glycoside hydrolase family 130 protein [Cyclobacteriaceae bacterium]|nr:glycoside hydrolase family 130 protein [Cyclobacteriaceae bacterium]